MWNTTIWTAQKLRVTHRLLLTLPLSVHHSQTQELVGISLTEMLILGAQAPVILPVRVSLGNSTTIPIIQPI